MLWGFTQLNGSLNKHKARTKITKMKLKEQRLALTGWPDMSRPWGTSVRWGPSVGWPLVKLIQIHQHTKSSPRNPERKILVSCSVKIRKPKLETFRNPLKHRSQVCLTLKTTVFHRTHCPHYPVCFYRCVTSSVMLSYSPRTLQYQEAFGNLEVVCSFLGLQ